MAGVKLTEAGVTDTAIGGTRLRVADALFVESAALVALIVIVCAAVTVAGAVYVAAVLVVEMVPTDGLSDQVTAVFVLPLTDAEYDCFCPGFKVAVAGVSPTAIGTRLTDADALLVESAVLVALMVMLCAALIVAGAVYTAEEPPVFRLPTDGLSDQVTPVAVVPPTDTVYDCVPPGFRAALVGEIVTDTEAGVALEMTAR